MLMLLPIGIEQSNGSYTGGTKMNWFNDVIWFLGYINFVGIVVFVISFIYYFIKEIVMYVKQKFSKKLK